MYRNAARGSSHISNMHRNCGDTLAERLPTQTDRQTRSSQYSACLLETRSNNGCVWTARHHILQRPSHGCPSPKSHKAHSSLLFHLFPCYSLHLLVCSRRPLRTRSTFTAAKHTRIICQINTKNCSLSNVLTATDQKPHESLQRWYYPPSHRLNVNVMLTNITFLMIFAGCVTNRQTDRQTALRK